MSDNFEKDGKLFCVKASWAQMERKLKGHFIKKLLDAGVENVVTNSLLSALRKPIRGTIHNWEVKN